MLIGGCDILGVVATGIATVSGAQVELAIYALEVYVDVSVDAEGDDEDCKSPTMC